MPIKGRLFPSQTKEERVFLLIRKHWFVYVVFGLVFLLMVIPLIAVIIYWSLNYLTISTLTGNIIIAGISAYLLSMLGVQLYGFVDYYLDVDIVTDRRIIDIDQNGLFKRKISELHLHQVQDVEAKVEGIAGTLLHFGDIFIQTAGERENFIFRSIPHPYTIAKQIVNLNEQQFQQNLIVRAGERRGLRERKLSFGELESQAKGILRSQPFSKRISNPGIFPAPGMKMPDDLQEDQGLDQQDKSELFQDNKTNSIDHSLIDSEQSGAVHSKKYLEIKKRKVAKKRVKISEKVKKERPPKAHSLEEGELKEGHEVDLKD